MYNCYNLPTIDFISSLQMKAPSVSWSGLLSDETDVDALSLSMLHEDIRTSASGGKGSSKRSSNYTQEEDISCACHGRVSAHILLLEMSNQARHIGKELLSTSMPTTLFILIEV